MERATAPGSCTRELQGRNCATSRFGLGKKASANCFNVPEWVIDRFQVSTDKRSGISNDPNRLDDSEYIVHLLGQVITVSLETAKIVKNLPPLETEQHGKDV